MRDKQKTLQALRRLAERPGTEAEGLAAREALKRFSSVEADRPTCFQEFDHADFSKGTVVYYNRWAYEHNDRATVKSIGTQTHNGETWLRLKFDHLKAARWVPVTSEKGSHVSLQPLDHKECVELSGQHWVKDTEMPDMVIA